MVDIIDTNGHSIENSEQQFHLKFNKFLQGIKDESKIKRRQAMESITKEVKQLIDTNTFTNDLAKFLLKQILQVLNDQFEKCRDLSIDLLISLNNKVNLSDDLLNIIILALRQRLGQKDIIEPSEEIRLKLFDLINDLINKCSKNLLNIHLDDLTAILQNSFYDNYAEVKKKGCLCTRTLAKKVKSEFHKQSEAMIKPLLHNITHQHSRVRKDIVECIGDVILYGNNKSVDEVLIHLSQRLFDQAHIVRLAVVNVVGMWLLDLLDRYSYHHKLMPLLLTGFSDEIPEIKTAAETFWWDIGIKYEKENETDLKDKLDFEKQPVEHYPSYLTRPNIGCRELIKSNLSRILPAILNDIGDWVESTRIKSIQLLYVFLWQAEENITQHLEIILQTLYKAIATNDNNLEIKTKVFECAKLIGYFTSAQITFSFVFKALQKQAYSLVAIVAVLNGLIQGYDTNTIFNFLDSICDNIIGTCSTIEVSLQREIINCCDSLLQKFAGTELNWNEIAGYRLFKIFITELALTNNVELKERINRLIKYLIENANESNKDKLYLNYMPKLIDELRQTSNVWNENSYDRLVFQTLIIESDLIVDKYIDQIVPILDENLNINKDAETRTKFLILLSQITLKCEQTNTNNLINYIEIIINNMIIPNLIWKAGRVATAIRMTATATLLTLFQAKFFNQVTLKDETIDAILKQMLSTLDDENKLTRLYTCKILNIILKLSITIDQLHKMYTEMLKRLDDTSEEIRLAMIDVFRSYFKNIKGNHIDQYDKILYQAHIGAFYQGLIIHLDDPNPSIQENILGVLKEASILDKELLLQEITKVKSKHRTDLYCKELIQFISN